MKSTKTPTFLVGHPFNKHLTLELYYTRQNDGFTRPGDLNIVWATRRVKL